MRRALGGFGEQGASQSKDCAFHVCTICKASIRMSFFVPLFFMYQIASIFKYGDAVIANNGWKMLAYMVLRATGNQILLLGTVLFHEFGHGNMARYLGGDIDHILLWVFGGICFSTRAQGDYDPRKILKNELLIVAAGPTTHIFQAPFWGLILWLVFALLTTGVTGYASAWKAFLDALNPMMSLNAFGVYYNVGMWAALLWDFVATAIQLNVALFLFNVFFPMYPADGSKLLVTSLMYCCGLAPRRAANVLLGVSVPCAAIMIVYSLYAVINGFQHSGDLGSSMMTGLMGFMGVMSLMESWKIYQLKKERRLHQHPLFQTARSWQREERDAFGVVHRINNTDLDDDTPLFTGGCRNVVSGCSVVSCLCPCFRPSHDYVGEGLTTGGTVEEAARRGMGNAFRPFSSAGGTAIAPASSGASAADIRAQRLAMLNQVEQKQKEKQTPVAVLQDQRAAQEGAA